MSFRIRCQWKCDLRLGFPFFTLALVFFFPPLRCGHSALRSSMFSDWNRTKGQTILEIYVFYLPVSTIILEY